jgi:NhaP-type Na+/H+ and K+/H+ antiporter
MIDKDPLSYSYITYAWVLVISVLSGVVSFHSKVKKGIARPWNVAEFLGEIATSGLVGVLTFYLAELAKSPPLLTAFFVGVSSHMATRIMFLFEKSFERKMRKLLNIESEFK